MKNNLEILKQVFKYVSINDVRMEKHTEKQVKMLLKLKEHQSKVRLIRSLY